MCKSAANFKCYTDSMIRSNYAKGLYQGKPNRNVITGSSFGKAVASAKEL